MLDKLISIEEKYENLTTLLMDPKVISAQTEFQKYSREYSELQPVVEKIREYKKLLSDIENTEGLLGSGDADFKELAQAEIEELRKRKPILEDELRISLLPVDPRDQKSVILEIRAGTGGEEAALFGASLFRMYTKYAESKRWKIEIININATGIGGIKEVVASIEGKDKERAQDRKSQVGTGDRSERIRTYNYPQNRVTDHRIGLTLHKLEQILEGNLDEVIDSLTTYYNAERLNEL